MGGTAGICRLRSLTKHCAEVSGHFFSFSSQSPQADFNQKLSSVADVLGGEGTGLLYWEYHLARVLCASLPARDPDVLLGW